MKLTWEYCGGLLSGLGIASFAAACCRSHDIHLPAYTFIIGGMLLITGLGITRGAQELERKERLQDEENKKACAAKKSSDA